MRRHAAYPFLERPFAAADCSPAIPFAALTVAIPFVNRVEPRIFGIAVSAGLDPIGCSLTPASSLDRRPPGAALVSGATVALTIVAVVVFGTIVFALLGVRRIKMDPSQYIVGGRSFGTLFLWVLLAGEIYTTFTFLGIAGLSYSQGAPAFYAMAYGTCAYIIGYFLTPAIWRVAKEHDLLTGPDFFEVRYRSRALGVGVAVLQFVMIVPYVALQLSGLQILLRIAGYGTYNATASVCIAFIVLALFVFSAGLRGTAWASVVKDVFVLGAVIFAGIAIPVRFFGSPAAMFDHVLAQRIRRCSCYRRAALFTEPFGTSPPCC